MMNEIALVIQGCLIFVLLLLYWRLGKLYEALTHEAEKRKQNLKLLDEMERGDYTD